MSLDRALQLRLLQGLSALYPEPNRDLQRADLPTYINLHYLHEHALVEIQRTQAIGARPAILSARITARGMDFLADDGGLTAILGVLTVKFDADTLRALLNAKIAAADLPEDEKSALTTAVSELPAEGLRHLTTKLIDWSLEHSGDAMKWIQTALALASSQ